jgi:hypothetical protein
MNLSTEVGTIAITLKVIFYLVHKKKQEPEMSESREHYLSCKEKTCTFLAFHCVQRDLHEVKGNQVVVLVTLENERERERERTSDKGTPPAVTNSSLYWPYIKNKSIATQESDRIQRRELK